MKNKIPRILSILIISILLVLSSSASAMPVQAAAKSPVVSLDETEIHHLEFIREEEKLARDVYLVLYDHWGLEIFRSIAESEQRHMDAMALLLAKYGLADPVTDDSIGAFNDPYIDGLYDWLSGWGLTSLDDALLVGAFIEEYDILDIWLAYEETDESHIQDVYQSLYEGSYNHLASFVYCYEQFYGDYEIQLLTPDEFDAVLCFDTDARQTHGDK